VQPARTGCHGEVELMAQGPPVELMVLAEAGCPFCQKAVVQWLDEVVKAPGMADIIQLVYHPFGNSFYATEACGGAPYTMDRRRCWARLCVGVERPPCDCFSGDAISQHGEVERQVNRMEVCAKKQAQNWQSYWQFVVCMEREFEKQGLGAAEQCVKESCNLDLPQLRQCYDTAEGDAALADEARATFDHDTVPYIAVNGQQVRTEEVLQQICAAYIGSKPAACPPAGRASSFWWAPHWT